MAKASAGEFAKMRPLAEHCAELIANGPQPEERSEHLRTWCRDLGLELASELAGAVLQRIRYDIYLTTPPPVQCFSFFWTFIIGFSLQREAC